LNGFINQENLIAWFVALLQQNHEDRIAMKNEFCLMLCEGPEFADPANNRAFEAWKQGLDNIAIAEENLSKMIDDIIERRVVLRLTDFNRRINELEHKIMALESAKLGSEILSKTKMVVEKLKGSDDHNGGAISSEDRVAKEIAQILGLESFRILNQNLIQDILNAVKSGQDLEKTARERIKSKLAEIESKIISEAKLSHNKTLKSGSKKLLAACRRFLAAGRTTNADLAAFVSREIDEMRL